jgi:hypothetical protein
MLLRFLRNRFCVDTVASSRFLLPCHLARAAIAGSA